MKQLKGTLCGARGLLPRVIQTTTQVRRQVQNQTAVTDLVQIAVAGAALLAHPSKPQIRLRLALPHPVRLNPHPAHQHPQPRLEWLAIPFMRWMQAYRFKIPPFTTLLPMAHLFSSLFLKVSAKPISLRHLTIQTWDRFGLSVFYHTSLITRKISKPM